MATQQMNCSDEELITMLRCDESKAQQEPLLAHVESCSRCQDRLAELAATEDSWQRAALALSKNNDEKHSDRAEWERQLSKRIARWTERPIAWDESMVKPLLNPPNHPEMLGRLGRYEIERLIGSGGMGIVFKAIDTELNRPVAIKILAPYLAGSGSAKKRFAREARAAAGVVDDHVVPIHNVETDGEHPFLVMKYIAGGSLQQRVDRDGPLEVCEVLRIGMQAARGLAAAHAQGLIHRDVKPSNILLDEGVDRALLTDFGLARATDDASLTRSGFHPGTPHYMSPEQVRGETIDARSDLFGLGCVLYALCTGHPPFRSETSYAVLRRITDETPRPIRETNPDVPEWLDQIVMKLLAKSPTDRFDSAERVANLLKGCIAHVQSPEAPLPNELASVAFKRPKSLFRFFTGVFVMCCFSAFALIFFMQVTEPPESKREAAANGRITPAKTTQVNHLANTIYISGKCLDEDGSPIRQASVELFLNADANQSLHTRQTSEDGTFDFGTFPDPETTAGSDANYIVVAHKAGKAVNYVPVLSPLQKASELKIILGVPGTLKGAIIGPGGSPLSGVRIRAAGYPWMEGVHGAVTNNAGEYVLDGIPVLEHAGFGRLANPQTPGGFELNPKSGRFLIVEHPDFGSLQPMYAECPGTIDVKLQEPARLVGRVLDKDGKPVPGIEVSARPSRARADRASLVRALLSGFSQGKTTTDAEGHYSISVQYTGPVEIGIKAQKHFARTVPSVVVTAGKVKSVPDISAVRPGFVSGRIVDVDTDKTVACPTGVRLRVYVMGDGPLTSTLVRRDGTYRLPVLPGTSYVYFSSHSLHELARSWDVLEHPNPLTAKTFPVEVATVPEESDAADNKETEVNFPVRMNKEKLGEDLKRLQGTWEIRRGTYVEGGNARLPLTGDRLVDGNGRPLQFTIRGNQRIGHVENICSTIERDIALSLCHGCAELTLETDRAPKSMTLTTFEADKRFVCKFLFDQNRDELKLVGHASGNKDVLPESLEPRQNAFVLVAERVVN